MSGIDQINEGGDFVIENGIRRKVGFTTDELTQNQRLAEQIDVSDGLSPVADSNVDRATDTTVDAGTGAAADAAAATTTITTTKKVR